MKVAVKTANCGDRDQCTNNGICYATSSMVRPSISTYAARRNAITRCAARHSVPVTFFPPASNRGDALLHSTRLRLADEMQANLA